MHISTYNNRENIYYTRAIKKSTAQNCPSFTAAKTSLLEFKPADFFVHIKGYGKNYEWAKEIKIAADTAVEEIKNPNNKNVNIILINIAKGVRRANQKTDNLLKQRDSGLLRTERKGYDRYDRKAEDKRLFTPITLRYQGYTQRLGERLETPLKNPYPEISLSRPMGTTTEPAYTLRILHGDEDNINNALDRIGGVFFNLKKDYILQPKNVTTENLEDITSRIAEMRWILAHATPWERGSDAIGNVFTRALYKSMGIKTSPLKKDVSLDFEAFCTPLDEYKKNFTSFFEKPPIIIK